MTRAPCRSRSWRCPGPWPAGAPAVADAGSAANRSDALTRLFVDADTNANIRGTRWAGYQAVTEYLDHAAPVHGKSTADKAVNRALRSIDGAVVETKEKAFALLTG